METGALPVSPSWQPHAAGAEGKPSGEVVKHSQEAWFAEPSFGAHTHTTIFKGSHRKGPASTFFSPDFSELIWQWSPPLAPSCPWGMLVYILGTVQGALFGLQAALCGEAEGHACFVRQTKGPASRMLLFALLDRKHVCYN